MTEHMIFSLMAFGPVILACVGVFLLVARWFAERDERKNHTAVQAKLHKRVTAAGILLILPGAILLVAKLAVMLRPR